MDTREFILDIALDMFSKKGYDAVSIRAICKVVGIKESTIYYHFKNKEDILLSLENKFISISNKITNYVGNSEIKNFIEPDFYAVCDGFIDHYLLNPFICKFICLMSVEQRNNDMIGTLYQEWIFEKPIIFQQMMFKKLIDIKFFKTVNEVYLAKSYYSAILFLYQKNIINKELSDINIKMLKAETNNYIKNFLTEFKEK